MKAELKRLQSPDVHDLRIFKPNDPATFSVFVQAMVGPAGEDSSESFDLTICTAGWLAARVSNVLRVFLEVGDTLGSTTTVIDRDTSELVEAVNRSTGSISR